MTTDLTIIMNNTAKAGQLTPACTMPDALAAYTPPTVAVMTLPDGSQALLRATMSGWIVTSHGVQSPANRHGTRQSDVELLHDIAAAYGFGPAALSAANAAGRNTRTLANPPKLRLVASR